jgi:hypothetical protein
VAVSLAANIAAAPTLSWQPVLVAEWPPLALLLAVELVVHSRSQVQTDTVQTTGRDHAGCRIRDRCNRECRDRTRDRDRDGSRDRTSERLARLPPGDRDARNPGASEQ